MFKTRTSFSKKRIPRNGVVAVEFALFLPVMVLICFGSIQISSSIFLRHQTIATLEAGSLDFMLGSVTEADLPEHIQSIAEASGLIGATATATPTDTSFLSVELTVPTKENLVLSVFVDSQSSVQSSFLIYRVPNLDTDTTPSPAPSL